jgi:hypothetical protein
MPIPRQAFAHALERRMGGPIRCALRLNILRTMINLPGEHQTLILNFILNLDTDDWPHWAKAGTNCRSH